VSARDQAPGGGLLANCLGIAARIADETDCSIVVIIDFAAVVTTDRTVTASRDLTNLFPTPKYLRHHLSSKVEGFTWIRVTVLAPIGLSFPLLP
jgi:hypothetical protein